MQLPDPLRALADVPAPLHVRVETWLSLRIFLCGLVMSVTPGKLGEVLKAYLVRRHVGVPVTRTGPIVVAERVTDLLALVLLLFVSSLLFRTGWLQLAVSRPSRSRS